MAKTETEAEKRAKRESYGFIQAFLDANPEIKKLVDQAVKGKWSASAFEARLKATNWYRTRSEAQRQYDKNKYDDPAELKRQTAIMRTALSNAAKRAGVTATADWLDAWAKSAVRNGWGDAEISAKVASLVDINDQSKDQTLVGQVGQAYDSLTKIAMNYGVPTTSNRLDAQIGDVVAGTKTVEDYEDYYRELAKKQYGGVADLLDKGMTTMDILDPYLRAAADDLGLSATNMIQSGPDGYLDPKWTRAIQGQAPLTLDEWRRQIRTDASYGWASTTKAKTEAASIGSRIASLFGAG